MQTYRRRKAYWQWVGMLQAISGEKLHYDAAGSETSMRAFELGYNAMSASINRKLARENFLHDGMTPEKRALHEDAIQQAMRDEPPTVPERLQPLAYWSCAEKAHELTVSLRESNGLEHIPLADRLALIAELSKDEPYTLSPIAG